MKEFFALGAAVSAMRAYAIRLEAHGDKNGAKYFRDHAATVESMKDERRKAIFERSTEEQLTQN